jgi:hypothetical protein
MKVSHDPLLLRAQRLAVVGNEPRRATEVEMERIEDV